MNEMETNVSETEKAVESIILTTNVVTEVSEKSNELKRKIGDLKDMDNVENLNSDKTPSPVHKRQFTEPNMYNEWNKGPFEVVLQNKDKSKINPFRIGKLLMAHHTDIVQIERSGKNVTVICKTCTAANNLVKSEHLTHFNVFVPVNRIHSTGVVFIEPDITEQEIAEEVRSPFPVVQIQRIKKRVNHELKDTHFVKVTFESDKLPEYITLNYVRMAVDTYILPVRQCYRCYSYGHVASLPCPRKRICRKCGDEFHGETECEKPLKCCHCDAAHSSDSRSCPEYIRQKNIKERMCFMKEDYHKASRSFPITYKQQQSKQNRSYAYVVARPDLDNPSVFPQIPKYSSDRIHQPGTSYDSPNKFNVLDNIVENTLTEEPAKPTYSWAKPKAPYKRINQPRNPRQTYESYDQTERSKEIKENSLTSEQKDYLKSLMFNKLKEIKDKVKGKKNITLDDLDRAFSNSIDGGNLPKGVGNNYSLTNKSTRNSSSNLAPDSGSKPNPNRNVTTKK